MIRSDLLNIRYLQSYEKKLLMSSLNVPVMPDVRLAFLYIDPSDVELGSGCLYGGSAKVSSGTCGLI